MIDATAPSVRLIIRAFVVRAGVATGDATTPSIGARRS
jgi:hypothetical protein